MFEVIQLQPQESENAQEVTETDEVPHSSNGESSALTLQEVTEDDCFASAVAEAIGDAEQSPSSPCMLLHFSFPYNKICSLIVPLFLIKAKLKELAICVVCPMQFIFTLF